MCASCPRAAFLHPPSFGIILLFNDNELIAYRCYAHGSSVPSFGAPPARAQYGSSTSQEAGMQVVLPGFWSVWWSLTDS